jgi:microcystin-dependent protein
MAGTLPGIANTQRVDQQGRPLVGGKLYLYKAGTVTPATAFKDFNLTTGQELPFPVELDEWGQIPPFYLADGFYRARLTNASGGTVLFDVPQLPAVGNPSGGDGPPPTVDQTTIFQTGDELWVRKFGSRTGWVRGNGKTIGNALSGASERANDDCQALFEFYWNNFSDALNPVVGGRGASSSADWAAGKQITLPNYKGKGPIGANQIGSDSAGSNSDPSFTSPDLVGSTGGASTISLSEAQLPSLTRTVNFTTKTITSDAIKPTGSANVDINTSVETVAVPLSSSFVPAVQTLNLEANVALGGGGAHGNMQPSVVMTCYVKL